MLGGIVALAALAVLAPFYIVAGILMGAEWVMKWLIRRNERRRERIEAELDRKQQELRSAIWQLASELGADAHEKRKALIRASFEASGTDQN